MREYKDGEQIFLNMFCAHCGINKTNGIGFYLKHEEYCVSCYPAVVNAYLAADKIKKLNQG